MKSNLKISDVFTPIQPSVKLNNPHINYKEYKPSDVLQDYIYCYWELNTVTELEDPYEYRVVSDGCIDIFYNVMAKEECFIMGFCKQFTSFPIGTNFHYAGIRFYPSIFPFLFQKTALTFVNESRPLQGYFPELVDLVKNLPSDLLEATNLLDHFFRALLDKIDWEMDSIFNEALITICSKHGHLETEKALKVGLSSRQLRRLFNYYIGTTPKFFGQVVRFQYILNAKPSASSLRDNKIFYDVGFYDQAHFIKSFSKFYGVTPSKAFR